MYQPLNVILYQVRCYKLFFPIYVFISSESNTMSDTFKSISIIQFSHLQSLANRISEIRELFID